METMMISTINIAEVLNGLYVARDEKSTKTKRLLKDLTLAHSER